MSIVKLATLAALVVVAIAGVAVVWLIFEDLVRDRKLNRLAFEDWLDRCAAVARQFGIQMSEVSGQRSEEAWKRRFQGGLTPRQAVQQERDALELRSRSRGTKATI
ncbi:MAG: hypothetical protein M3O82_01865 [Verrucomicrobiota bacterium]|nr:hypothetical protein [Verrucomicrobiota bacterium]